MLRSKSSRRQWNVEQLEARRLLAADGLPVTRPDSYEMNEDASLLVSAAQGVLANDESVSGRPLTAELIEAPRFGTFVMQPDGSFVYTPIANYNGTDSFSYIANDGECASEPTSVQIGINGVYDPVFPAADVYKLRPGESLSLPWLVGVLANDLNPDGADLVAVLDQDVSGGELTLNADGSFQYDSLDFGGTATFSYRVDDGTRLSQSTTVRFIVNSAPVATDDTFSVGEDELLDVSAENGVLANDTDSESDVLTVSLQAGPTNGELTLNDDGSFQYVPFENYFGSDQFSYVVSDGEESSRVATVNLNVESINDLPIANADAYFVATGGTLEIDAESGPVRNDTDVEGAALTLEIVERPRGELSIGGDGDFVYVPPEEFVGEDTFTYVVSDNVAVSQPSTVIFFVGTSPVRISEFLAANTDSLETRLREEPDDRFRGSEDRPDWLEVQNLTDAAFDLGGFHLSDNAASPTLWTVPTATIVPPAGRLVVFASGRDVSDPRLDELGNLHANFTIGIKPGVLQLSFPDGRVAQSIEYPQQFAGVSYGFDATDDIGFMATSSPGEANEGLYDSVVEPVTFSRPRGFYEEAFDVALSTVSPGAVIRYTTDGSAPTAETGAIYESPISVSTTTTLRAAAFRPNHVPSQVVTNSYLFLNDVIDQPFQREGYPDEWSGMPADYGMDPDVVGVDNLFNDLYRDSVVEDLKTLPTLSLSFAADDVFGSRGIYQRPTSTGDDWERPVAVEYISPDGSEPGFHLNSGVRVMGGSSRQPDIPKHSFRLEFREMYGAGKLEYPLFDDAPYSEGVTDEFDELVVRVGFNNSWMHRHYYQSLRGEQPRDQWVRDLHASMGHPGARGHYVHVYLNGMYWGIYNLHERPAAPFMEEYFGGNKDTEWNVINSNEAIDGELRPWTNILAQANRGLSTDEQYRAFEAEVDTVSLADYMLLNFYVGNTDWDGHNWITARRNTDDKWRFYAWDSEFAISLPPPNTAVAENAERQIINMDRTSQNSGNGPSRLHTRASANEEYRLLFADRIHKHFFNGGTLSPETATEIFTVRTDEIDRAVVAESARWGDFRRDVNPGRWRSDQFDLYHRDEHYVNQRDFITERYLPVRTDIVLNQLKRRRLYPDVVAPEFSQHGGRVAPGFSVSVSAPAGTIYVTTDGSDPRVLGGAVADSAQVYASPIELNASATVKARVLVDGEWSALNEAYFQIAAPASAENLRITEVNYHPADPTASEIAAGFSDADEFEFLEFANISNSTIDISEVSLIRVGDDREGVEFAFAEGGVTELRPLERIVVVENVAAFEQRYGEGVVVAGQWAGQLSNAGELITVAIGNEVLQQFSYDDEWYPETDGLGQTLEIVNPAGAIDTWNDASSWEAIGNNGTPGNGPGDVRIPGDSNEDGIFDSADLILIFQAAEYEDDIDGNSTFAEGDWNGDGDFTTRDLVYAFQFGNYMAAATRI